MNFVLYDAMISTRQHLLMSKVGLVDASRVGAKRITVIDGGSAAHVDWWQQS